MSKLSKELKDVLMMYIESAEQNGSTEKLATAISEVSADLRKANK